MIRFGMVKETLIALTKRAKQKKLSVRAWLAAADVSQSTYYRWLNGDTKPSTRTLEKLELVLK